MCDQFNRSDQVARATRVAHGSPNKRFFCFSRILSRSAQELGQWRLTGPFPGKAHWGAECVETPPCSALHTSRTLVETLADEHSRSVFFDFSVAQSSSFSPSHFFSFSPFPSSLSSSLCSSSLLFLFFFSLSLLLLSLSFRPSVPPSRFRPPISSFAAASFALSVPPLFFPTFSPLSRLSSVSHALLWSLVSLTLTVSHSLSCDNTQCTARVRVACDSMCLVLLCCRTCLVVLSVSVAVDFCV